MRKHLQGFVLYLLLVCGAFAALVEDGAGLLSAKEVAQLETRLAELPVPVHVVTFKRTAGDLRGYTDRYLQQRVTRGYAIAISLEPRAWRISKFPVELASSREMLRIGERVLKPGLQSGKIAGAIEAAAKTLVTLPPALLDEEPEEDFTAHAIVAVLVVLGLGLVIMGLVLLVRHFKAQDLKRREALIEKAREKARESGTNPEWTRHSNQTLLSQVAFWGLMTAWYQDASGTPLEPPRVSSSSTDGTGSFDSGSSSDSGGCSSSDSSGADGSW